LHDVRQRRRGPTPEPEVATGKVRKAIWAAAALASIVLVIVLYSTWSTMEPRLYEVTGTVTIDGKPADNVMVYFWPGDMTKKNFAFRHGAAMSDSQGRFSLKAGAGAEGLAGGDYRVTFSRLVTRGRPVTGVSKKQTRESAVETIPVRFREIEQTPVTATVSDKLRDFTFAIESK
jgi:hypothetical protein